NIWRQRVEEPLSFVEFSDAAQRLGEVDARRVIVGIALDEFAQHLHRGGRISAKEQRPGLLAPALPGASDLPVEPRLQPSQRLHADEAVDQASILENAYVRNAANRELRRERWLFICIDAGQVQAARIMTHQFLEDRPEGATGRAPRRPEVDGHRSARGAL